MLATNGKFNKTSAQRQQGCVSKRGRAGTGQPHTEACLLEAGVGGRLRWSREFCNGLGCLAPKWP